MKYAIAAAVLAFSSSTVLAAAQVPELDPNVVAAQGSFTEGSQTIPTGGLPTSSPVPEADVLGMLAAGVAIVGGVALRRRNRK